MDEKDIRAKEAELRRDFPEMFNVEGIKSGEICFSCQVIDVVDLNAGIYKSHGLTTVRVSDRPTLIKREDCRNQEIDHRYMFASVREFIEVEDRLKNERAIEVQAAP